MNGGQIVGFLWTVAVWSFLICVFVVPIALAYWYAREHRDAEATEEALKHTHHDTSGEHIFDA